MNTTQLLKLLETNRELIMRNNAHAVEHYQMLKTDFGHIKDEEVVLAMDLSASLAEKHIHSNHAHAIEISLKAISNYNGPQTNFLLTRHFWLVGHSYVMQSQHDKAEYYLLKSLNTDAEHVIAKSDGLIALAMNEEIRTGEHGSPKAAEYINQALEILKGEEFEVRRASCLIGLGNIFINAGNLEDSLVNYMAAAEIYEKHFDLANMAAAYCNIGTNYYQRKEYDKAERYIGKSLDLRLKGGTPDDLSISYYNLAILYKDTGRLKEAYNLLLKTKDIEERTGNLNNLEKTEEQLQLIAGLIDSPVKAA